MKQTAVDWLFEELNVFAFSYNETSVTAPKEIWEKIYKKAKQMEKEQIQEAYTEGCFTESWILKSSEEYYQETYAQK